MNEHSAYAQFDAALAGQLVDDFYAATGVGCRLFSASGKEVYACLGAEVCAPLAMAVGRDFRCAALHENAADQALRFGGRYIYTCPMGLAFFAAPIMAGGVASGSLVAGPVQIMDTEDLFSGAAVDVDQLCPADREAALAAVSRAPRRSTTQLQSLSRLLFADAVYLSDSAHELLSAQSEDSQRGAIDNYIAFLKRAEGARVDYPLLKEQELFRAVVRGDRDTADQLLNQILGHIYFYAKDEEEIKTRVAELFIILLRAAASGGANTGHVLELSGRYLWELRNLRSQEELTGWLAHSLRTLTDQVFPAAEIKHSSAIQRAIDYIKRKYALGLTLEEVAEHAGYSPAYFSRIFREDTGMTFKEYLSELRIEKSKSLLLTSDLSITEISSMLGFNDQSYFCKLFKRATGVTPDKYRKRSRRLNYEKEYGRG